jgi:hypothetical protein
MSNGFVVFGYKRIDGKVSLDRLVNVDDAFDLMYGRPRAKGWPSDASFSMRADRKDNTILTDTLSNTDSLIIASEKLVALLRGRNVASMEYLPLTIFDHKKKPVKTQYYILNPVSLVDCVDVKASGGKASPLDPDALGSIERLVLDERRVPADRQIFRTKSYPQEYVVRKELAEAMDAAGIVGPRWIDPLTFPE